MLTKLVAIKTFYLRMKFFVFESAAFIISVATHFYYNTGLVLPAILALLFNIDFFNSIQPRHAILRNFLVLGYFRYSFETIALEIQQYCIERTTDGKSFS